jgi:hypothetical protein
MIRGQRDWLVVTASATAVLGTVTGVVVGLGPADVVRCTGYLRCLAAPGTWLATFHVVSAGVLLLLSLLNVGLAWRLRGDDPALLGPAAVALAVLGGMASLGGLLATGELARSWAPVQYVVLGAFAGLTLWLATRASRQSPSDHAAARPQPTG